MKSINKFLKEIRLNPNVDMLILKPNLYVYIPKSSSEQIKNEGLKITTNDNSLHAYFSRIPSNTIYKKFLDSHDILKIAYSKLKRLKDQKVKIYPVNIPDYDDNQELTEPDIKKLCQKTDLIQKFLSDGLDLPQVPHCKIQLSNNFLPSWTFKIIEI